MTLPVIQRILHLRDKVPYLQYRPIHYSGQQIHCPTLKPFHAIIVIPEAKLSQPFIFRPSANWYLVPSFLDVHKARLSNEPSGVIGDFERLAHPLSGLDECPRP